MRGRIGPGIAGWLAALAPLVIANLATYLGLLSFNEALLAGTLGLAGGILLGGIVTGALGGRRSGTRGAVGSGIVTAVLYSVSVIALNTIASLAESSVPQIVSNPIPACMTVLFCAALLIGVALLAGAFASARPDAQRPRMAQQPQRRPVDRATVPLSGAPGRPSQFLRPPAPRSAPPTVPHREWRTTYDDDPRTPYDAYGDYGAREGGERLRTQSRQPADVLSRPSGYRQGSSGQERFDRYGDRRG